MGVDQGLLSAEKIECQDLVKEEQKKKERGPHNIGAGALPDAQNIPRGTSTSDFFR